MSEPRRVLLDECIPARLRRELPGFNVRAVREYGWAGKLNGDLIRAANEEFDVFVTVDRNLVHQQNLSGLRLGVILMLAFNNSIQGLRPLIPQLLETLATIGEGEFVRIGPPTR